MQQVEITREYIEQVEEAIERKDSDFILSTMADMHPADVTTVLYELDTNESKYVMDLLPPDTGAQILSDLDYDIRTDFLGYFTSAEIARYVNLMDSDDAVDILNEQSVQLQVAQNVRLEVARSAIVGYQGQDPVVESSNA